MLEDIARNHEIVEPVLAEGAERDIEPRLAMIERVAVVELPGQELGAFGRVAQPQAADRLQHREFGDGKRCAEQLHAERVKQGPQAHRGAASRAARLIAPERGPGPRVLRVAEITPERRRHPRLPPAERHHAQGRQGSPKC